MGSRHWNISDMMFKCIGELKEYFFISHKQLVTKQTKKNEEVQLDVKVVRGHNHAIQTDGGHAKY